MRPNCDHTVKSVANRAQKALVFHSNAIPSSNTSLNMLTYRSFDLIATLEELMEIII